MLLFNLRIRKKGVKWVLAGVMKWDLRMYLLYIESFCILKTYRIKEKFMIQKRCCVSKIIYKMDFGHELKIFQILCYSYNCSLQAQLACWRLKTLIFSWCAKIQFVEIIKFTPKKELVFIKLYFCIKLIQLIHPRLQHPITQCI